MAGVQTGQRIRFNEVRSAVSIQPDIEPAAVPTAERPPGTDCQRFNLLQQRRFSQQRIADPTFPVLLVIEGIDPGVGFWPELHLHGAEGFSCRTSPDDPDGEFAARQEFLDQDGLVVFVQQDPTNGIKCCR